MHADSSTLYQDIMVLSDRNAAGPVHKFHWSIL